MFRSRFYEAAHAKLTYRSNTITLTALGANQVTVGKLAYRLAVPLHKTDFRCCYVMPTFSERMNNLLSAAKAVVVRRDTPRRKDVNNVMMQLHSTSNN